MARRIVTVTAENLSQKPVGQSPVPGLAVGQGTSVGQADRIGRKAAPALAFAVPRADGTRRTSLSVPLSRPLYRAGREGQRDKTEKNRADRWLLIAALLLNPEGEAHRDRRQVVREFINEA